MSIDTQSKRLSILDWGYGGLPTADGILGSLDRQHLLGIPGITPLLPGVVTFVKTSDPKDTNQGALSQSAVDAMQGISSNDAINTNQGTVSGALTLEFDGET